jgi:hypothetical protein
VTFYPAYETPLSSGLEVPVLTDPGAAAASISDSCRHAESDESACLSVEKQTLTFRRLWLIFGTSLRPRPLGQAGTFTREEYIKVPSLYAVLRSSSLVQLHF